MLTSAAVSTKPVRKKLMNSMSTPGKTISFGYGRNVARFRITSRRTPSLPLLGLYLAPPSLYSLRR